MKIILSLQVLLLIISIFLSHQGNGQDQGEPYPFKFTIYKNGHLFESGRKNKVTAFFFNYEKGVYEKVKQTTFRKNQYSIISAYGSPLLLKIHSGKDSMILFTATSLDSLEFRSGIFNYSGNYSSLPAIIPLRPGITIQPGNPAFKTYPQKSLDFFPKPAGNIIKLNVVYPELLKISKTQTIYAYRKSMEDFRPALYISHTAGNSWMELKGENSNDEVSDICLSEKENYIKVFRGKEELYFPLEEYFRDPGIAPVTFKHMDTNVCNNELPSLKIQYSHEPFWLEEDTCNSFVHIDGEPVFRIKQCLVNGFDLLEKKPVYHSVEQPSLYELNDKKVLVFKYFILLTFNGINWYYFQKDDFYGYLFEERADHKMYERNMTFYWLEGKGLLVDGENNYLLLIPELL